MKRKKLILLLIVITIAVLSRSAVFATESGNEITEIHTLKDFENIKNNPYGSYILMNDIDFAGALEDRIPFAFYGKLNGNGHMIYNICSVRTNDSKVVYDANLKEYNALCSGLFSVLEGAEITDLDVYNADISLGLYAEDADKSMFLGIIAGYAYDSSIKDCNIYGKVYACTSGHCFGTGGVFGFAGNCRIENCTIDSTLICIDTDTSYKDEQFMGGVYSFGYCDLLDSEVRVYGYDSDHGYVHNGGIVGCFMYYDKLHVGETVMSGNSVKGRIKFYEDNNDRRAYCRAYGGEMMSWDLTMENNTSDFVRDEVYEYDTVLLPENDFEGLLVNNTDILLLSSHADDEQLFFAGLLPYYSLVRDLNVQVVYATDNTESTGRNQERENGLYAVGITNRLDSLGYADLYSESLEGALNALKSYGVTEETIISDLREMILKYKPKVIVTHDVEGEYGHGMHILMSSCLRKCVDQYHDEFPFLEKVYLHLYDENSLTLDVIDETFEELGGLSPFQYTQEYGFSKHKSQHWTWFYGWIYGKDGNVITDASQIRKYSPLYYGLYYGDANKDCNHNDLFEGLSSYAVEADEEIKNYGLEIEQRAEEERKALEEAQRLEEEQAEALRKEERREKIAIVSAVVIAIALIGIILLKMKNRKHKA